MALNWHSDPSHTNHMFHIIGEVGLSEEVATQEPSTLSYQYILTSIMSPLSIEHLDIVTQNFDTKFSSVKLPRYYPYHP
jgi:hypothetical protein